MEHINKLVLHLTMMDIKMFCVVSQSVDVGYLEVRDGHPPLVVDRGGAGGHGAIAEKWRRDGWDGPDLMRSALRSRLQGICNI